MRPFILAAAMAIAPLASAQTTGSPAIGDTQNSGVSGSSAIDSAATRSPVTGGPELSRCVGLTGLERDRCLNDRVAGPRLYPPARDTLDSPSAGGAAAEPRRRDSSAEGQPR